MQNAFSADICKVYSVTHKPLKFPSTARKSGLVKLGVRFTCLFPVHDIEEPTNVFLFPPYSQPSIDPIVLKHGEAE